MTEKISIIAEIGINHNGQFDTARKLIEEAKKSNVNMIKFQYRNVERCYIGDNKEIGDEILSSEINRNYLNVDSIIELNKYSRLNGLKSGISFFITEDIRDFENSIEEFDFYKIPSPEFTNLELIKELLKYKKDLFISTGAHKEEQIENVFNEIKENKNWYPFHCISNYPTEIFNCKLGYINFLKKKWKRDVGYSSHDYDWRVCIAAMSLGIKWIERHITLDKENTGLDHSTSSTPDEFKQLSRFCKFNKEIFSGNENRTINQGEHINLQNLGRSFYAKTDIKSGDILKRENLQYRSPKTGIGMLEINEILGQTIGNELVKGSVLTKDSLKKTSILSNLIKINANEKRISLPVRFHDLNRIREQFKLENYELHLSYTELIDEIDYSIFSGKEKYSIHLPDYISSTDLLDPFSINYNTKNLSLLIINNAKKLANYLYDLTETQVPIVVSLSNFNGDKNIFYHNCKDLYINFSDNKSLLTFQILPPYAWYFGGSVEIEVYNSLEDWKMICDLGIPLTLDLSHLIMCCNFHEIKIEEAFNIVLKNTKHIHISLAEGIDGEGKDFNNISPNERKILEFIIDQNYTKVIEVWQGHLNNFSGFTKALVSLDGLA